MGNEKNIPDKLQGIKMYKDSINLLGFFAGVMKLYSYGIWVKEFSFSYDIVDNVDEKDEEEYKKNLMLYKDKMKGKFINLVEKIEIDTPLFFTKAFNNELICDNADGVDRSQYVYLKNYDINNILVLYKQEVRKEYVEKVKKLINYYSIEIAMIEIEKYGKKYANRKYERCYYGCSSII